MNIAFVIPSFGPGGAERVASLLCNFWSSRGNAVTAIAFDSPLAKPFHVLDPAVELRKIDALNVRFDLPSRAVTNVRRLFRLRSLLRLLQPNVIVSFTTEANLVALMAGYGLGVPVVVSERNQPDRPGLDRLSKMARSLCYPNAAGLVVQTEALAAWARRHYRVPVFVVPNPIHPSKRMHARPSDRRDTLNLVAVGRLVRQKGYDLLVESFASLAAMYKDWQLTIYGDGPERPSLQARIDHYDLQGRIFLPGLRKGIQTVLAEADLFVHPSRYEGFPNALMEALASGCPVVASACDGTTDILGGGQYGLLVPVENVEALSAALAQMMSSPALRATYAEQAPQSVAQFDIEIIGERWLNLLAMVTDKR